MKYSAYLVSNNLLYVDQLKVKFSDFLGIFIGLGPCVSNFRCFPQSMHRQVYVFSQTSPVAGVVVQNLQRDVVS